MKKTIALIALLLLPLAAGCQTIADARTNVCNTLRGLSQSVVDLGESVVNSKPVATVGELRLRIRTARQTLETIRTVSQTVNNGGSTLDLIRALDDLEKSTEGMPDNTPLSQVADTLRAPATQVKTAYDKTFDAICAAK
jgi:predicted small secreted protein